MTRSVEIPEAAVDYLGRLWWKQYDTESPYQHAQSVAKTREAIEGLLPYLAPAGKPTHQQIEAAVDAVWYNPERSSRASMVEAMWELFEHAAPAGDGGKDLRELVDYWKVLTEKPPLDEFDRGVRAARLEVIDALRGLLGGAK